MGSNVMLKDAVQRALEGDGPRLSIEEERAGLKVWRVSVIARVLHIASVNAVDEREALEKIIRHQFGDELRPVRTEISTVDVVEEREP